MILDTLIERSLPGAAGGLTWFVLGVRLNRIHNDKYLRKLLLEALGGMLCGTFIVFPWMPVPVFTVSFFVGVAWAELIQRVRKGITIDVTRRLTK